MFEDKTLGTIVDELYETRQNRLAIEKQVKALQEHETAIRNYLIDTLPKSDLTGGEGVVARAYVELKEIMQVDVSKGGWDAVYEYIMATGNFFILNKALNQKAVAELVEEGEEIPGIVKFRTPVVRLNKK